MQLYNKSFYNLSHGDYRLIIGETKEIPDKIAENWLNIQGIVKYVDPQQAQEKEKELSEENKKLKEEIKQLKQSKNKNQNKQGKNKK